MAYAYNGCKHYMRNAKLITPCCLKAYICRLCHDEKETHVLDRKKVETLICMLCDTKQNVSKTCKICRINFGEYSCLECRLFDKANEQFHCQNCGICRVGPKHAFYHCEKCNLCLNNILKNNHTCIENVSRDNCSVCMEDMHNSTETLSLLICGHFLHKKCYEIINSKLDPECPLCRKKLELKSLTGIQMGNSQPDRPRAVPRNQANQPKQF